jgi:predicted site-specific integrase-resolvase
MLTTREVAAKFGVSETAVHEWGRQGLIKKCYTDSLNRGLWGIPIGQIILKGHGGQRGCPARLISTTAPSKV